MLYIFSGLPGSGKTTLSSALAQKLRAAYLRVDVVEQALRDAGVRVDGPEGYIVCYALAAQHLRLGLDVIADTVNPIPVTRQAWHQVADSLHIPFVDIEVICSDKAEHRQRVETRVSDIAGHVQPTWDEVVNRHYEDWDLERIVIDTAWRTVEESLAELTRLLNL
ncbi:AAA family ATPase [Paenibacillus sp. NFR01]|uniref:AAA family ATPase n=1 Tax=Paenibacillus sp. NFR01 TaxID=1566279 RepID=UPI0008C81996|nr:AAA family ATPase [Paenibacillus sp. NFR01]SET14195.1 Predicted kinase [Paenibacillus sp. NFR01]